MYSPYVDQQINTFERQQREQQAAQQRLAQQCRGGDGAASARWHAWLARWLAHVGMGGRLHAQPLD